MFTNVHVRVARVDALRRVAELEVRPGTEPRARLEQRAEQLLRGARVRGALEHDACPGPEVCRNQSCRVFDVPEVGDALVQRGLHGDQGDIEAGERDVVRRRPVSPGREGGRELVRRHVFHVRLTVRQETDARRVELEADDVVSHFGRPHRQQEPDVTLPDDHHALGQEAHRTIVAPCITRCRVRALRCTVPYRWATTTTNARECCG